MAAAKKPKLIFGRIDVMTSNRPTYPTPGGDGTEWIYREKRDPDTGEYIVYAAEKKYLQDEIQAAYEDTKIYNILARVSNGEIEALNVKHGMYADISNVPTSIFEMEERIESMKQLYKIADCSEKFTFDQFLELAGTKDFRDYFRSKFEQNTQPRGADQNDQTQQNAQGGTAE